MIEKQMKNFFNRPLVSGIMAILAIFGVGWAIFEHYYVANPKVALEIVSEAQLFNSTDRVSSIHLFIDSLDVQKADLNVTLYTIKVINKGRKHVSSSDYESESFGISISGGKRLDDTILMSASNDYITDSFAHLPICPSDSLLLLPYVALDIGDSYVFSLALLHRNGELPVLSPIGKILGQKRIPITYASDKEEMPFFERVLFGDFWVHLVRIIFGLFLLFAFSLLAMVLTEGSQAASEKRYTRRVLKDISNNQDIPPFIKEDVSRMGIWNIEFAAWCFKNGDEEITRQYSRARAFVLEAANLEDQHFESQRREYAGFERLIKAGYLARGENGELRIPNNEVKEAVELIHSWLTKYRLYEFAFDRNLIIERSQ